MSISINNHLETSMTNTFERSRRTALASAALLAALASFGSLAQAAYPERPVRIVVGFAAGTGPDILARLLAQQLSRQWGDVGVVVDNKAGAAGLISAQEVARAAPDGYTLLLAPAGLLSIAPSTYTKLPYDPVRDFIPISMVADSDFMFLVNPQKVPARNVKEFVEWAQKHKDLFFATFGAGTVGHFGAYLLGDAMKVKLEPVHYRSTSDAMVGMYSGDVQGVFASVGLAAPQVKSGKLIALASSGHARDKSLPDVPTFKEAGYPDITFTSWMGLVAPAKTPPAVVAQLEAAVRKATREVEDKIEHAGFVPKGTSAAEFARVIKADAEMWGKVVRRTGFKAD